jgi:hypothetical protein
MAHTRLLQTVCTVAILAAAPAFAQTNIPPANMPAGDTAAGGAPNNPTAQQATPNSNMAPADRMGSPDRSMGGMGSHAAMDRSHRTAMAMHTRSDASQNAAVDQLNEQSYQAARSGQAFNGTGTGSGVMAAPGGSGRMMDMQHGPMPDTSRTGGAGDGGGGSGSGGGSGM